MVSKHSSRREVRELREFRGLLTTDEEDLGGGAGACDAQVTVSRGGGV